MKEELKKSLLTKLASMDMNERNKILKRASALRNSSQERSKKRSRRNLEEDDGYRPRRSKSIEDFALEILLQEHQEHDEDRDLSVGEKGIVVGVARGMCRVRLDREDLVCTLTPSIAQSQQSALAVGDEVLVSRHEGGAMVRHVLPRRSLLSRPDPDKRIEQAIVANVDLVVIVVSVVAPPLHPRLIDRYLVAVQRGGAAPVLAVNKIDLLREGDRSELDQLGAYGGLDMPVVLCSSQTGQGVAELREVLRGRTCAFVGHSGVGKSSLANAMAPNLALATGEVSQGYGRGTHTTTSSSLHELEDGTRLIDTPGIRSFGLSNLSAAELKEYFPEFENVGRCRFGDCMHTEEPGCLVKEAVEQGLIAPQRYDTYLRILDTLK